MKRLPLVVFAWFTCLGWASGAEPAADRLATPVKAENLDAAAFAQWVDGAETPIQTGESKDQSRLPAWALYTDKTAPGHSGVPFGAGKKPGPRHLRIGFNAAIPVGAVLVRGGGAVSVLRPQAAYPGDLSDESQWIPAQRIKDGKLSTDEVGRDDYALWTLPQLENTRAIRFTHVADVTEKEYAGQMNGAFVFSARMANVAPQAFVSASADEKNVGKLVNEKTDPGWDQWQNIPLQNGQRAQIVSPENPEWVLLVWAAPVKLRGLGAGFAGFNEADVQAYEGPANVHPREAPESAWHTIKQFTGLKNRYPTALCADWLDFGQDITTRAIRVRITKAMAEGGHPHTQGHPKDGKRVWLGELFALLPLDEANLKTALLPKPENREQPPIAIHFTLPEPGYVTLVIEDETGHRVRNLISETHFEQGANTVWWDGSDDLARDQAAASHGMYLIPTQLVAPGKYHVRGLWRKQVDVRYEFGIYSPGSTPWETSDSAGGWLSNHTPASGVLFVPDGGRGEPSMLLGSYVSEGTAGLAWVDLDGNKWKGKTWVGGNWTGAPYLARDAGEAKASDVYAYVASAWSVDTDSKTKIQLGEIRVTGLTSSNDKSVVKYKFTPPQPPTGTNVAWDTQIGGLAVHNGIAVVSLPALNQLLLVDAKAGKTLSEAPLEAPQGLAFDSEGRLLALSGHQLVRFSAEAFKDPAIAADPAKWSKPETLASDLDEPRGIALDAKGNVYVSLRGKHHQVQVFSPVGKATSTIGKAGVPQAGPYDPLRMNNPRGLSIDERGRLWVAEEDYQPKRVSVWNADGTLVRAFYGPAEYGGGGALDPKDKTKFYYNGMEFKLDWKTGHSDITSVFYRHGPNDLPLAFGCGVPQGVIYSHDHRYFTDTFNSNPTNGQPSVFLFVERDGVAVPCAGMGRANEWDLLKTEKFASVWPKETDPKASPHSQQAAFFVWNDLNGDGQVQAEEIQMLKAASGGITVAPDLSFVVARLDGKTQRLTPRRFTAANVPVYEIESRELLVDGAPPTSSGGDQALMGTNGWTISTTAAKPYRPQGLSGTKDGVTLWSYPSLWPGLHASHEAPVPDRPGEIIGTTRLIGDFVTPRGGDPLWMLNCNNGSIAVFTADGLFVCRLFQDMRLGRPWRMPTAQRGMLLNEVAPGDENFWPSVTQTADGEIYLVAGGANCLVRVDGLDTIHRIQPFEVTVSAAQLNAARDYFAALEAARQAAQGHNAVTVDLRKTAPVVDGKLDDWANAAWVDIDKRGVAAYFDSNSRPYNVTGAVAVADDRLYAAWRTGDANLLKNTGEVPTALFKTGGALDLMIGTNPQADPKRSAPVAGDVRLLVTLVGGKPRALLYRPVVAGEKEPVPFSSPWRTISFDRVDDVSDQVQLAGAEGNFEISLPLKVLGLSPKPGQVIQGDIGILRGGEGNATVERIYWSNKATAIVADVPSEAELRPNLWGRWEFRAATSDK